MHCVRVFSGSNNPRAVRGPSIRLRIGARTCARTACGVVGWQRRGLRAVWYSYIIRRGSAVVCAELGVRLACFSARSCTGETALDKALTDWCLKL